MKPYTVFLWATLYGGMSLFATNVFQRQLPLENNRANELFASQAYEDALKSYLDLYGQDTQNGALAYNIGNTYAVMGDLEKAGEFYQKAMTSTDREAGNRARFNLGNLQMAAQQHGEAVKQYIDYLRQNPDDVDAKRNLELALRQLEQMPQQQQPQDQENEDQEQEQDQEQSQDQQQGQQEQQDQNQENQQDSQDQDQQEEGQQQNQPDPSQQEQQQQQGQPKEDELDESMKEQILQALKEQEMQQQKEYQKRKVGGPKRRAKDW